MLTMPAGKPGGVEVAWVVLVVPTMGSAAARSLALATAQVRVEPDVAI
jgi:hypothetical protein